MPKIADHPRASLARTLELAAAVEELGGECSQPAAAARLGAKPGGTFGALVSTAVKYGWVAVRRGRLRSEPRYRDYRLAYNDAERRAVLFTALQAVPLFRQLVDRFAGRTLPEPHLPKLLAREFDVPETASSRVAGYFVEAAVAAGLLAGTQLRATPAGVVGAEPDADSPARIGSRALPARPVTASRSRSVEEERRHGRNSPAVSDKAPTEAASYRISIVGPDVDTTVGVATPEDLELVRAALDKVARGLRRRG
jgi:hypothetical protein